MIFLGGPAGPGDGDPGNADAILEANVANAFFGSAGIGSSSGVFPPLILGALTSRPQGARSGLILLFERPFRVGDVITVDALTGRVTRIRTRATTILDFDNREIVVPNKNFITGQLLNWTLSDTTTRISIKVGVAYGTDPEKVDRLLLEAAAGNPLVQRDPEPRSWFLAFGASSLDFELRVFVGTLADRLQVTSELHREIVRLFAEHDIEIAFPQMDIHVRDLPESRSPA
jgi:potassium efflux system protein